MNALNEYVRTIGDKKINVPHDYFVEHGFPMIDNMAIMAFDKDYIYFIKHIKINPNKAIEGKKKVRELTQTQILNIKNYVLHFNHNKTK